MKVHVTFNNQFVAKAVLAACRRRQRELQKRLEKKPFIPKEGNINIAKASINSLDDAIKELSDVIQ